MNAKVLKVVEPGSSTARLGRAADAIAAVLAARVEAVGRDPLEALLARAGTPEVLAVVLPVPRRGADPRVRELLSSCPAPVLAVPEGARASERFSRALVPLDGTAESAAAVARTLEMFTASGADIVVLHVFDQSTVPRFWDQWAHARRSWEDEFLARYCPQPGARLALRTGAPGEQVVDVAAGEGADLIVLGWSQRMSEGHARTVRTALSRGRTPVLLVPVGVAAPEVSASGAG